MFFIFPKSSEYPILQIPLAKSKGFGELEDLLLPPGASGVKVCVFVPLTWAFQSGLWQWAEQDRALLKEQKGQSSNWERICDQRECSCVLKIHLNTLSQDLVLLSMRLPIGEKDRYTKPKGSCGPMAAVGGHSHSPAPVHCLGMDQARPSLGGQGGGPTPAAGPVLTGAQVPSSLPASRLELRKHLV